MERQRDNRLLSIGKMARCNGVTPRALRVYQREGLLEPAYVDEENGNRYYDIFQSRRVDMIHELQNIGFSIDEIKEVDAEKDLAGLAERAQHHLADIARTMGTAPQYLCGARAQTGDAGTLAADPLAWSIEVTGAVEHPFEATIEQMVDEASQTVIMGCSCAGNPADGLASINAEVTGIAVAELLNHARPSAEANTIVFTSADGYEVALPLRYVLQHYCPIVFDVNGSPIAESMGGTNQLWLGSTAARYFARDIVRIELQVRDVVPAAPGSGDAGEAAANLPNVGVYFGGEVR